MQTKTIKAINDELNIVIVYKYPRLKKGIVREGKLQFCLAILIDPEQNNILIINIINKIKIFRLVKRTPCNRLDIIVNLISSSLAIVTIEPKKSNTTKMYWEASNVHNVGSTNK